MKRLLLALTACAALASARGAELEWFTDLPKAQEKARAEGKMVLMDFTGSDWCIWCVRLDEEIFSKPEFAEYAAKHLVPVKIDFPRKKEQPEALKQANRELARRYKIQGYPTLIVLNGAGKQVGQLGYMKGGPKPFLAELDKLKAKP